MKRVIELPPPDIQPCVIGSDRDREDAWRDDPAYHNNA
jgi:hypothetical protein